MMLRQKPNQILGQIIPFLRHFLQLARRRTVAWFNPSQRRLRLRRRLFLYTVPVAALLAVVVAGLISVVVVGNSAVDSFNRHDIEALRIDVDKLKKFGVIEAGSIAFAEGDLLVLEGKLDDAEKRFSEALESFDGADSCPVRINLELVRETLADLAVRSGRPKDADRLYNDALAVVKDAPDGCFLYNTDPNDERRAVRADAKPRLERKLAAMHAPPPPPPTGPAVVTPEPPPPPPALSPPPGQGIGQGDGPGEGPGQAPGQGQAPPPPPQGPGAAPALPPMGQGGAPQLPPLAPDGQSGTETPPLPSLPGENLPAAPPPPPAPPGAQPGPGDGPLQVADPRAPNPAQILGPVGPDGLPLGDKNTSAPDLRLEEREGHGSGPADKLQSILEDASAYGGERE
ncbi:tetratricopeptide repeat protein [Mycolicibacterium boenickei]|uniref:tetratricopeptide repeat protein n=1 Tax=Mycolicibacterium boenickei TaxID=146017 RepID=UPI00098BBB4F|nr:tetratricopeptide repeat protein [Mycolicibacterium boenickei]